MPDGREKRQLRFLIIKTSSLGDIIQAFNVLDYLHQRFPSAQMDWVTEKASFSMVKSHPLVQDAILFEAKTWKKSLFFKKTFSSIRSFFRRLRRVKYDAIFDLQGNCKSGVVTFLARAKKKVGFDLHSVREWPNVLATSVRFNIPKTSNIRLQYLKVLQNYFQDSAPLSLKGVRLNLKEEETEKLEKILTAAKACGEKRMMVCPHAKWPNKQLDFSVLVQLLRFIHKKYQMGFLFLWGNEKEREFSQSLKSSFSDKSILVEKLSLPTWQNLMNDVDLVFAVDSSAMHLCGTTSTPSFSVFGPTSIEIYKPLGKNHFALQGPCPYGKVFKKHCPLLRTCPTGACIRKLESQRIIRAFASWWEDYLPHKDESVSKSI